MRNFDEERAERLSRSRTFQIGGETFEFVIGMTPEDYAEAIREYSGMIVGRPEPESTNGDAQPTKNTESIGIMDRTIKNFLVSDEMREKWDRLRQRKEEPITSYDLGQVAVHVIQEQMGNRPSQAPGSSGSGPGAIEETSTESSSSAPEPRVVSEA